MLKNVYLVLSVQETDCFFACNYKQTLVISPIRLTLYLCVFNTMEIVKEAFSNPPITLIRKITEEKNVKVEQNTSVDNEESIVEECISKSNSEINDLLNHIINSPAVFQSQQIGDPELSPTAKRRIAEDLINKNPVTFLYKFGMYLNEKHLNYFFNKYGGSYEINYYTTHLKALLNDHHRKIIKKNRRYNAMQRMEEEGNYFSESEMEKREPLLYHELVGQFLSEKEKFIKKKESSKNEIPSFLNFLIDKIERDELDELIKSHFKEENSEENNSSSENEPDDNLEKQTRWGEYCNEKLLLKKTPENVKNQKKIHISTTEKELLLQEFKSIMQNRFLNGKDSEFNYSDVDCNSEYDSIELKARDEEEKYFDEETVDYSICTDTGIEDY